VFIHAATCTDGGILRITAANQILLNLDPFQKDVLFLFCGRRKDHFKGLVWRGDGFLLIYKRIESGYVQWPRDSDEMADISPEEFRSLLDGFQILAKPTIREAACTEIA
jgi:transposase